MCEAEGELRASEQEELSRQLRTTFALKLPSPAIAGDATSLEDSVAIARFLDLAKAAQNPVASLISLPLQNNTNFGVGPGDDVQNVLNIQPVIPFNLGENWKLITRTIAPVIYQPELVPGTGSEFGLGDINTTLFFSPTESGKII